MRLNLTAILLLLTACNSFLFAQNTDSLAIDKKDTLQITNSKYAYVVFDNDTLFTVGAYLGPYSPEERAESASSRLKQMVDEYTIVADSFIILEKNNYSIISYSDFPLISVSEADAAFLGKSRHEIAKEHLEIIKSTFRLHHSETLNNQKDEKTF